MSFSWSKPQSNTKMKTSTRFNLSFSEIHELLQIYKLLGGRTEGRSWSSCLQHLLRHLVKSYVDLGQITAISEEDARLALSREFSTLRKPLELPEMPQISQDFRESLIQAFEDLRPDDSELLQAFARNEAPPDSSSAIPPEPSLEEENS